jgi:heme A synthase
MEADQELSSPARERMAAMLPDLLGAVRGRRRRRKALRASVVALVVAGLLSLWLGLWPTSGDAMVPASTAPTVATLPTPNRTGAAKFACEIVHDLPDVVARLSRTATVRADCYISDADLQAFLRDAQRPQGLVRISGKVTVASAAIDAFPVMAAE